jgi:hypothetical protein
MSKKFCRACDSRSSRLIYTLKDQPVGAWAFDDPTRKDLDLFQCDGCGLVQLVLPPVPYWREDRRAVPEEREYAVGHWWPDWEVDRGYTYPLGPAKVFHCNYRLEHFPDPLGYLIGVRQNLHPEGRGTLFVPNFDYIVKHNMLTELCFDHLSYFTKDTLTSLLERAGFNAFVQEADGGYALYAIVTPRRGYDLGGWDESREVNAALFTTVTQGRKVALYGAGHQAIALLAIYPELEVSYVVDDTPEKQGRKTPGTCIPIYPPSRLVEDPVDIVIIACGSWSDIVAEKFEHEGKYILRKTWLEKA